ncbi:MAG: hypothetical protein ABIQ43_03200 [Sphingomonas sp.]
MKRFVRPILTLVASIIAFAAQPAAADDGRRHVLTPLQKIDLVRDLPDEPAFERDGNHFDLGYIYPIHTVNGASVASSGGEAGFVLYHDDKYVKVDGALMTELRYVLGDDPTQGYTPPTPSSSRKNAAADPWGASDSADAARGQPLTTTPARSHAARRSGFTVGTLFLFFVLLFIRVRAFRDLVIGGTLAAIAAVARGKAEPDFSLAPNAPNDTVTAQAAVQRARLDALSGTTPRMPNAAPSGFGRKQA